MTEREQQELARIIVERNSGKNQFAGLVGVVYDQKISSFLRYIGQDLFTDLRDVTFEGLCAQIDAAVQRIGDTEFLSGGVDRLREVERRNSQAAEKLLES